MRVLITGTSSGIGKAIAEKFLKEGFDVTGFDRKAASIVQEHYTHFCLDIRDKKQYPSLAPFDIVSSIRRKSPAMPAALPSCR